MEKLLRFRRLRRRAGIIIGSFTCRLITCAQLVPSLHHRSNQRHVAIGAGVVALYRYAPDENKSAFVRLFYFVSTYLGSRSFYEFTLPVLVWVCAEESKQARFLVLWYCLTSSFGCLCKGAGRCEKSTIRSNREVSALGALRNSGSVHAWPSVAGMNASFIPFFLLRWKHGSVWLWEMENPYSVVGDYDWPRLRLCCSSLPVD